MTGSEYQKLAIRTYDGRATERLLTKGDMIDCFKQAKGARDAENYDFGGILNACLGLSGEIGEFNDMIKKWIFHENELDKAHLKKEIGDVMWYVAMVCESAGFDLDDVLQTNIDKLKARYPEGFDTYLANHREEGDI